MDCPQGCQLQGLSADHQQSKLAWSQPRGKASVSGSSPWVALCCHGPEGHSSWGTQALVHKEEPGHAAADRQNPGMQRWGQLRAKSGVSRTALGNQQHQSCSNWKCKVRQQGCQEAKCTV